ncbi:MAG: hypothetical protein WBC78_25365 [Candidatus Sulfotelmatobacter sp.]
MEALTRLVADSLTRHGLDRPVDPRRLQWSRWFRCDSPHSLLVVPSKPGIFALAEEIMDLGATTAHVGTAPQACPEQSRGGCPSERSSAPLGGAALQRCDQVSVMNAALAAEVAPKRMLAVLQFSEDDDMAYVLDRMFTRINPMRSRLASGRCFVRFVVMDDQDQRRSICTALNQWLISSAEKASGLPPDFSSSLELTESLGRTLPSTTAHVGTATAAHVGTAALGCPSERSSASGRAMSPKANAITHLDSGAARNLHCPQPLPSGF